MKEMEWEWKYTNRATFMWESSEAIKDTEKGQWSGCFPRENTTTTKVTGTTDNPTAMVCTPLRPDSTGVSSKQASAAEKAYKSHPDIYSKVISPTVSEMVRVFSMRKMFSTTKESSDWGSDMVMVSGCR